jgi:hypothetical protein
VTYDGGVYRLALAAVLTAACNTSAPPAPKLELIDAPTTGAIAPYVQGELAKARADRRKLLVYVGATWCEPCEKFHAAATKGQLDEAFSDLRLLVYDLDIDGDRLAAAGYTSRMIPLFVVPREDGTSSGKQIEGSVKGNAAIADISQRLRPLVGR